jgi:hypothetical protein
MSTINLNSSYSREAVIREAAKTRVQADYYDLLSSDELNKLVDSFLGSKLKTKEDLYLGFQNSAYLAKDLLVSPNERSSLRDRKFFIETLNRGVSNIATQIEQSSLLYNDLLRVGAESIGGLASSVFGDFGAKVTMGLSQGLGYVLSGFQPAYFDRQYLHLQDPRTGRKFLQNEYLDQSLYALATMPVRHQVVCDIADIDIDAGLTGTIGFESYTEHSSPRQLVSKTNPFHIRFFLGQAAGEVPVLATTPLMTVVVRLSSVQNINRIAYEYAVDGVFKPSEYEYWDGSSWVEWTSIASDFMGVATERILMETVFTDKIRIIFTSRLAGDANAVTRNDISNAQLNQLLTESKWSTLLPVDSKSFNGVIVDWYIKCFELGYVETQARGYAVSKPLVFDGKLKRLVSITKSLDLPVVEEEVFTTQQLNDGSIEGYIEVQAWTKDRQELNELIPCPSQEFKNPGRIYEWLPLVGNISSLRFFPVLNLNETTLQPLETVADHTEIQPEVWSSVRGVLTIGDDYLVSVDAGKTWLSSWPASDYYGKISYAGDAAIKIVSRSQREDFAVSYFTAMNQWLSRSKSFHLHGTRVYASDELKKKSLSYEIRHAIIARQPSQGSSSLLINTLFVGEKHES